MDYVMSLLTFDLTPQRAVLLTAGTTAMFVGSMYFSPAARREDYNRDHKHSILARAAGAGLTSASSLALVALARSGGTVDFPTRIGLGGGLGNQLHAVASSFGLTTTLFLGVIVSRKIEDDEGFLSIFPPLKVTLFPFLTSDGDYVPFRNYVLGPVTEEIVFRSCALDLLSRAGFSTSTAVAVGAANFALAHVHHLYFYLTSLRIPMLKGFAIVVANLLMHSVFALYSSFIYTRTASLPAAVLAHSYCNILGPPSFGHLSNPHLTRNEKWSITAALVGGAGAFVLLAGRLAQPAMR